MLKKQTNKNRRLERKKKLSTTVEYHIFLEFRRYYTLDEGVKNKNLFNEWVDLKEQFVFPSLERIMILAYTFAEGKLSKKVRTITQLKEKEDVLTRYTCFLLGIKKELNLIRGNVLEDELFGHDHFPLGSVELEAFDTFFELVKPNLLLLEELDSSFREITVQYDILPIIVGYFSLFEVLDREIGYVFNRSYPEELTYSFKTKELKEAWKNKWKNPNFSTATFQNVSREVQNMLLKDDKIEHLFNNIFDELNYEKVFEDPFARLLPIIRECPHKNLFPVVKERIEKNLPYMNYLYLEEEEKQPEEVKEVNKEEINVENLLDKKKDQPSTFTDVLGCFRHILLDIMFSQVLQELFKEYEFYHKKIVTMAPAIIEGDVKALEENPNAEMRDFGKVGAVLYKLYLYLGIYKSIIGYQEFYFKPAFYENVCDPKVFGEGFRLYWALIKFMGDFELEIEGQESFLMDVKAFPKDGKLRAKIKRRHGKQHTVFWDLQDKLSILENKEEEWQKYMGEFGLK